MSTKDFFNNNKKNTTISKYLKKSSVSNLGEGIESAAHLSESLKKRDTFVPRVDYSNPSNFAKFGSAQQYYQDAFQYITGYYPYDGASADKLKFYNDLNSFEKYVFNDKYTKSTGYVQLGYDYGTSYSGSSGYWMPDTEEYIQVKGGPHRDTKFSVEEGRTNNLTFGGPSGSTVEFYFKKSQGIPSAPNVQSGHQVIFDAWNGENVDSSAYGRLRIEIVSGSEDRFYVTMLSGTATNAVHGFLTASVPSAGGLDLTNNEWKQYSFVFNTETSTPVIDFYINGECYEKNIIGSTTGKITQYAGAIGLVTGSLVANVGSIRNAPWGRQYVSTGSFNGFGKLSASLDEFRFWKKARNGQEVGRNWFTNVNGGSDRSTANVDLGVYLTFNEGITQTSSIDSVVLDYSGRVSNGLYVGYDEQNSRSTGSAINDLQMTGIREAGDPIVRISNPLLVDVRNQLVLEGENYDRMNAARLINNLPNWVIEEDEQSAGELTSLLQIMANKFDEMYAQITSLSEIKNIGYISGSSTGSIDEFPHNDRLVENMGLTAPEIFENIGPYGQFLERDEQINFEQRLEDVKNTIYKNIYNNLVHIFKSKGTEKSVRNFIRCLGVGEEIISLNAYGNETNYVLSSSYKTDTSSKKFVDFSGLSEQTSSYATVYQYYYNNVDGSQGLITSASANEEFAFTLQSNLLFPNPDNKETLDYTVQTMVSSSLVGFHTPDDPDVYKNDLTWAEVGSDYGLQLYFVKSPAEFSPISNPLTAVRDGYFCLTNATGEELLRSSVFSNVYDNRHWNVAVSVRPSTYPFAEGVAGTTLSSSGVYTLEMCGYNYDTGILRNEFSVSTSMNYLSGSNSLNLAKRIYAGAHRTNYTGSLLTPSDIRATGIRYWSDYLSSETIKIHARELESFGRLRPTRNMPAYQVDNPNVYIPDIQTLSLNWDFSNVTGSDSQGQFQVTDLSSGSSEGILSDYQNTPYSEYNLRQHTGKGDLFKASSTPVLKEYVYTSKLQPPDYANSSDMVRVLTVDDETYGFNSKPISYFFAVEKSMYRAISARMLELFASIEEYNNLIGDPVNKYRPSYKRMEKLREIFFQRVQNDKPDLQKYLDFYKWLDSSMNRMIEQLLPASARTAPEVRTMIESHVLERPKISYKYPQSFKRILPNPLGRVGRGWEQVENGGGWRVDHAPLPRSPLDQNENCLWWKRRIYPLNSNVSSSDAGVNNTRLGIYNAIQTDLSSSKALTIRGDVRESFVEGLNAVTNRVHGVRNFKFRNFRGSDLDRCKDNPELKPKMLVPFEVDKDNQVFDGNLVSPFIALSSSVTSGYISSILANGSSNATASSIDFANLHNDFVRPNETSYPLQGPFTTTHVGGIQARHVAPLAPVGILGSVGFRPEAFNLRIESDAYSRGTLAVKAGTDGTAIAGETLTLTIGGVAYSATFNNSLDRVDSTKTQIGVKDATGGTGAATIAAAIKTSMDLSISADSLPVSVSSVIRDVTVTHSEIGPGVNGTVFGGSSLTSDIVATSFAGGTFLHGEVSTYTTGSIPKGQYLRNLGSKSPVNIANIRNVTGSNQGVKVLGNYNKNYEVVQSSDRITANVDFVYNNASFYGGPMPTAFLTPPSRRSFTAVSASSGEILPETGSIDYAAPRQIAGRKITKSIIATRFAAPGSPQDSNQQFRDIATDQMSPNNALPFRNIKVRKTSNFGNVGGGLNSFLSRYNNWGGFYEDIRNSTNLGFYGPNSLNTIYNAGATPSNFSTVSRGAGAPNIIAGPPAAGYASPFHKIQRNTTAKIEQSLISFGGGLLEVTSTGSLRDNAFITRPVPQGDRNSWFVRLALGGADASYIYNSQITGVPYSVPELYNQFILSGSRYPQNITVLTSSLSNYDIQSPAGAQVVITVEEYDPSSWNNEQIDLVDAAGTTVRFRGDSGIALNGFSRTAGSPVVYDFGVQSAGTEAQVAASLFISINQAATVGDFTIGASYEISSADITLTQATVGPAGNTTVGGTAQAASLISTNPSGSFAGGQVQIRAYYGDSAFTGTSGELVFPWSKDVGSAPWSQVRNNDSAEARFYINNNIYEFFDQAPRSFQVSPGVWSETDASLPSLNTRTVRTRTGNNVGYNYASQYKEPAVTSKYKPLVQNIKTFRGTPEKSEYDVETTVGLKYSYGNMLMGFANKAINNKTIGSSNFMLGKIKRPYEVIRDNKLNNISERTDGVRLIKLTAYPETIYPSEVYTYMSGTRARSSFSSSKDFWRNDILTGSANFGTFKNVFNLYAGDNAKKNNRQFNRIKSPFITSQYFQVLAAEQEPSDTAGSGITPSGNGSGSLWPMDSFLYSDSVSLLGANAAAPSGLSFPEIDTALTGGASTMAAGELMMPHYGAIIDDRTSGASGGTFYTRSSITSAQYVFTSPTAIPTGSHGNNYNSVTVTNAPGGQWTRPPWTAGSKRRHINGSNKFSIAPTRYPFYDNYEDYSEDIKRISKDQTIVPEFRISEHISDYNRNGALSLIAGTLSLTGAVGDITSSSTISSNFLNRYGKTDKLQFLEYFMGQDSQDLEFNKYPKQFSLSSDATLKLLPYDGFYPVVRTLQLASLYNDAYAENANTTGESGSASSTISFRPLLAPFFAPGILYNSIKSGISVSYPVKRQYRNRDQYLEVNSNKASLSLYDPLHGCLSGTVASSGLGEIPGDSRRPSPQDFINDEEIDNFFWSEKLPFESILDPSAFLGQGNSPIEDTNINEFLYADITASIGENPNDSMYKGAISNFIAAVPQFFLKKKHERFTGHGFMTKFVANFTNDNRQNAQQGPVFKTVDPNGVYMMEIGIKKTDNFNLYNNPFSFGIPTATGSIDWKTFTQHGQLPSGSSWPKHRGEFAPYTPPYYYGTSVVRLTYTPTRVRDNSTVSLEDILYGPDLRVEFLNESGSYYDFSSGSYTDVSGNTVSTTAVGYGYNRAWQNRMDVDASLVVDNNFPIDNGGIYNPIDEGNPNRWVIMPKWETPVLDFPVESGNYNFSASVIPTEYTMPTYGMWHQYGVMPNDDEGIYVFLRDVGTNETETRLIGNTTEYTGEMYSVRKVPKVILDSNRLGRDQEVQSLASLVGFDPTEIMSPGSWEPNKAKRIGELAEDEEKTISEAIVALPYYYDSENNTPRLMTLRANPQAIGPKIKEFRKAFTKYSFPPALAQALEPLVPSTFPVIPGYINPFGDDDYDAVLEGSDMSSVPVIYMMEYGVTMTQQDLGDIWQGIMPEISKKVQIKNTSIDHYMPQSSEDCLETPDATYPEIVLAQRLDDSLPESFRTGVPRPDLLDTVQINDPLNASPNGFNPEIKWLVFKVKQRGVGSYTDLVRNEVIGYDSQAYDKVYGVTDNSELNAIERRELQTRKDNHARTVYRDLTYGSPKFNWPYDYFSLVETAKISAKVGFRPDLEKETDENNRDVE